jgi:XTP/dITP diphosphohydrolase
LVLPDGTEVVEEGVIRGRLLDSPRGSGGFGYDPIFVAEGHRLTSAELSEQDKDAVSHRGRALRAIAPVVAATLGADPGEQSMCRSEPGAGEGT